MDGNAFPEIISTPYPWICLMDLEGIARIFASQIKNQDIENFCKELFQAEQAFAPPGCTFYYISADKINEKLSAISEQEASKSETKTGVVQLDRYIASKNNNPNFFRLNISRGQNNSLVARPGIQATPEGQLNELVKWAKNGSYQELVFVDDVLAFADTLIPLLKQLRERLPEQKFKVIVGLAASGGIWRGLEKIQDEGVPVEYLTKTCASPEINGVTSGMAICTARDMTVLGGKIGKLATGEQISYPYFLPFSKPNTSFVDKDKIFIASYKFLDVSRKLLQFLEREIGKIITLKDFIDKGFGIPFTNLTCLQEKMFLPSRDTRVLDYIDYVEKNLSDNSSAIQKELQEK